MGNRNVCIWPVGAKRTRKSRGKGRVLIAQGHAPPIMPVLPATLPLVTAYVCATPITEADNRGIVPMRGGA
jgi:hypothetical protein